MSNSQVKIICTVRGTDSERRLLREQAQRAGRSINSLIRLKCGLPEQPRLMLQQLRADLLQLLDSEPELLDEIINELPPAAPKSEQSP